MDAQPSPPGASGCPTPRSPLYVCNRTSFLLPLLVNLIIRPQNLEEQRRKLSTPEAGVEGTSSLRAVPPPAVAAAGVLGLRPALPAGGEDFSRAPVPVSACRVWRRGEWRVRFSFYKPRPAGESICGTNSWDPATRVKVCYEHSWFLSILFLPEMVTAFVFVVSFVTGQSHHRAGPAPGLASLGLRCVGVEALLRGVLGATAVWLVGTRAEFPGRRSGGRRSHRLRVRVGWPRDGLDRVPPTARKFRTGGPL